MPKLVAINAVVGMNIISIKNTLSRFVYERNLRSKEVRRKSRNGKEFPKVY